MSLAEEDKQLARSRGWMELRGRCLLRHLMVRRFLIEGGGDRKGERARQRESGREAERKRERERERERERDCQTETERDRERQTGKHTDRGN